MRKCLRWCGSRISARLRGSKSLKVTNLPQITFFLPKMLNLCLAFSETKGESNIRTRFRDFLGFRGLTARSFMGGHGEKQKEPIEKHKNSRKKLG